MGTCFVVRDQRMILRGLVGFVLFDVGWSPMPREGARPP